VTFKKFNEVAELLGMVAIVASLIFVGMQLRQSQRIALAEVEVANSAASIELASLLSDHSEVWARGITGEELEGADAEVFDSIMVTLSDNAFSRQQQFRLLGDDGFADAVVHEFAAYLHDRPGSRRAWIEREASLKKSRSLLDPVAVDVVSEYVDTIMKDLAELDRIDD
jgi:hypothetical protein